MSANYGGRWRTRNHGEGRCICGKAAKNITYPEAPHVRWCSHECARAFLVKPTAPQPEPA